MRPVDADIIDAQIRAWIGQPGYGDYWTGYDNALCAIQDFIADIPTLTPQNKALTIEQLREMDGVNALWLQKLGCGPYKPRLMLIHSVSDGWWTCCDFYGFVTFSAADYGGRYLLYRCPPERQEGGDADHA